MPSPNQDGGGGGLLGRSGLCGKEVGEQASWGPAVARQGRFFSLRELC